MIIVDGQQNIAFNARQLGRDYPRWAWLQRQAEAGLNCPTATTSLRDNLLGRVAVVIGSIAVISGQSPQLRSWQRHSYRNAAEAETLAQWQLDHYLRLAEESERIDLVFSNSDLDSVLSSWESEADIADHKQGIVIGMKGGAAISEPLQAEDWLERGVRVIAPAWQRNQYCDSEAEGGDLTLPGYELLEVMAGHGALLDIANMPDRAASAAIERYEGAIICSHGSAREFHGRDHGLSDAHIRLLAERDGVLGLMLYNGTLRAGWHPSDPKRGFSLSRWADAVDYVCQLTGSVEHVALGSDIDGGYAYSSLPEEIDTSSDLWRLRAALLERGFDEADCAAVLSGNLLRKLRESLPEG